MHKLGTHEFIALHITVIINATGKCASNVDAVCYTGIYIIVKKITWFN